MHWSQSSFNDILKTPNSIRWAHYCLVWLCVENPSSRRNRNAAALALSMSQRKIHIMVTRMMWKIIHADRPNYYVSMNGCSYVHVRTCTRMCEINLMAICPSVHVYMQMGIYIYILHYLPMCLHICVFWSAYVNTCNTWMMLVCRFINACTYKYILFDHTWGYVCMCSCVSVFVDMFVCV